MKKVLFVFLIVCAFVALMPKHAYAEEYTASGTCGDDLTWTLDNSGILTVFGSGALDDYERASDYPWYTRRSAVNAIVITDGVTYIGDNAFHSCSKAAGLTLPEGITYIGDSAFYGCNSLTAVTVPAGVTEIGACAFMNCESLETLVLPDGVTSIGERAFHSCESLSSVTIPDGVSVIEDQTFYYCSALASVTIPDSVVTIGKLAFHECGSLTSITIPNSVTRIESNAFSYCDGLVTVKLSEGISQINTRAFYHCDSLSSVEIPEGVVSIGASAFYYCKSLSSLKLPSTLKRIEMCAFYACGSLSSLEIPDAVTYIGVSAFYDCESLTDIALPESLTTIEQNAFSYCESLTSVAIPHNVTVIGQSAFYHCESLTWVDIPDSITSIESSAFRSCESLTSVIIPNGVTKIGQLAFHNCSELSAVAISRSVAVIEDGAFYNTSIATVCYEGTQAQWENVSIDSSRNDSLLAAQINYGHSYKNEVCKRCGKTKVIASIMEKGNVIGEYAYFGYVTSNYDPETQYIVLREDVRLGYTMNQDLYIDLNGYNLTGMINTNGYHLYLVDSNTDSYSCDTIGYFSCEDADGNAIIPVSNFKTDKTGSIKRYLTVKTENGYTFHRFYLGITHTSIKPSTDSVGFKAVFAGDEMVQKAVQSYGYGLQLDGFSPETAEKTGCPESGKAFSMRIENFKVETYSETDLTAWVYITVNGETVTASAYTTTFRQIMETVNTNCAALNTAQLSELKKLIERHAVMKDWKIENLI